MKKTQIEILSDASNHAVLRHPDREYPGSLVQGDSLYSLLQLAEEAQNELVNGHNERANEALAALVELLSSRLEHYETMLKAQGINLPYVRNT